MSWQWLKKLKEWLLRLRDKLCGDAPSWVGREEDGYEKPFHITDQDRELENIEFVRRLHGLF